MFYDVKKLEIALVTPDTRVISAAKSKLRTDSSGKRSISKEFVLEKDEMPYELIPNSHGSSKLSSGPLSSVLRKTMIRSIKENNLLSGLKSKSLKSLVKLPHKGDDFS